ncbi:Cytochrome P450 72A13 [Penicillium rolfsii]|nr:Cytochrome P450 72A13 [Penicillium rolfsii]
MFVSLLAVIVAAWWFSTLGLPLFRNWSVAQKLRVPVIVSPIPRHGRMWMHFETLLKVKISLSWRKNFRFLRILRPNWPFLEKHAIFEDYGDVFAIVTPVRCELFIADARATKQILMRRKDFPKPLEFTSTPDVDGADWSRHIRCTAVAFSETTHEAVWKTSCFEASKALQYFLSQDSISSTHIQIIRLSFAVLLKACLGMDNDGADTGSPITNAAKLKLESFFNMIPRIPDIRKGGRKSLAEFYTSYQGMKSFMSNLVKYRRHNPSSKKDLLSSLLISSDAQKISDEEIESNLFLFMFAGHETTANTLVYTICLLAIFPEWQTWAMQEIDEIFPDIPMNYDTSYKERINRLTRYETLRLYGPVVNLLRRTSPEKEQTIICSDESTITIPANTLVNIHAPALHTHPDYWGSDALSWKPDRWLSNGNIDSDIANHLFAWSEGPRACPGRRFSQIEIFAVIVTLLRQASIEIVPRPGVSLEEAQAEALCILQNSRSLLTLHIEQPDAIHVRWCPRR